MPFYQANIKILLHEDTAASACDFIAETLRANAVDWSYIGTNEPQEVEVNADTYCEGDFINSRMPTYILTPEMEDLFANLAAIVGKNGVKKELLKLIPADVFNAALNSL